MKQILRPFALAAAFVTAAASNTLAHPDRGEKRPQSFAEAVIPMTEDEWKHEPKFRHTPGNVRAEDMYELFAGNVIVVDQRRGRNFSVGGGPEHALKVIFLGKDGRYVWCAYDKNFDYFSKVNSWAPIKVKHRGRYSPRLDPAIHNDNHNGISPLYDGATGRIAWYGRAGRNKTWVTWDVGHLQERLPRAVWTLCPDFPSAEELGVGVNENQTAITYDKLLEQDPGQRILRPDLITLDPTEPIK